MEGIVEEVLTSADRCDNSDCNAQAYYLAIMEAGQLYFCRHHFHKHEDSLKEHAYYIIDQSESLLS